MTTLHQAQDRHDHATPDDDGPPCPECGEVTTNMVDMSDEDGECLRPGLCDECAGGGDS
jgi:hypothetical protein